MAFKTLEEANEYEVKMEKQYSELQTAHEGLKTKLTDSEKTINDSKAEIERLKAKNYELFEMVSVTNTNDNTQSNEDNSNKDETSLDDVINNFI